MKYYNHDKTRVGLLLSSLQHKVITICEVKGKKIQPSLGIYN